MSSMVVESLALPKLAGARPAPGPRSLLARWRDRRAQLFPGLSDEAFEEPIRIRHTPFGVFALISDPAGVKRVLVDNVANYPKTALERRFFTAIFGAGLLGSDGDLWRTHRRIMAPSFDPRSVAAYGPAVAAAAAAFVARWDALPAGAVVDMADEMSSLALRIISRTMFSTDDDAVVDVIGATLRAGMDAIGDVNVLDILPITGPSRMRRRERRIARLFGPLDEMVSRMLAERESRPAGGPSDLLGRLMAARDHETGAAMTAGEVRDEVVTIFMAGHETTAMTMDWIWYLLSQHPREVARLHEELDGVLGGRTPAQDDVARLPFTRRVVEESMRLYPAAPGLSTRVALEADAIGGAPIAKGTRVGILPWVLHRHGKLWDDPERFDPDRFSTERAAGRLRFAFLPFGAGPRVCIGQVLAMSEAILILATLAQHYNPRLAPDARVALQHSVTLRPRYGLKMILERRRGR